MCGNRLRRARWQEAVGGQEGTRVQWGGPLTNSLQRLTPPASLGVGGGQFPGITIIWSVLDG